MAKALDVDPEEFEDFEEEDGSLFIEENYGVVWLDDLERMAIEMAKAAEDSSFTMRGRVDCAENSGEIMDFEIHYISHKIIVKNSGWFCEFFVDEDMSFEEFCEEYGIHESQGTEEKFPKAKQSEEGAIYVLDSGQGEIVSKVELSNVHEIKI